MTKKVVVILISVLIVGLGCGYSIASFTTKPDTEISLEPTTTPKEESKPTPNVAQISANLKDRDTLLRILSRVHDSTEGFEYTENQLKELQANPENKVYSKVLQKFVQSRLNQEVTSFQTISDSVNPRSLLITTNDQHAYMVYMKKDYSHDGIWIVSGFMDYMPQENQINEVYTSISLTEAPGDVKEWAQSLLKQPEWRKEFRTFGDRTYALIKSSSSFSDSVELEEVMNSAGEVYISYQTYQYPANSNIDLINDYLLLELKGPGIRDVIFQNTYSNFPLIGGKEPVPGDEGTLSHLKDSIVLDQKFMELAAMGKIRGVEYGIGATEAEVIAKWGKPHEIGSRQVEYQQWNNYQLYYWPPDHKIGAIRILGASVPYTLAQIKKSLGNPTSEVNGVDGIWSLLYQAGDYGLYVNATTPTGQVESVMLKKNE
ncbi:DUF4309 domain-containing protein [Paenibacillus sp. Soil750]|uniref:DUF4309 domain-containing protein n=1 Tax=Paenibacillus sp. Soil750 TaxID=1736398 RepID=UPI0006FF6438|nr:DUF4309 domain-containing protein [Paenibacillus sp. Soil750]KRE59838.1 hypothetical protein ASL11_26870 [Paenibacillus sp. Soil750]